MPVLALFRVHPALSKFLWIFRDFRLEWSRGNCNVLPSGQIIGDKRNKRNADLRMLFSKRARGGSMGTKSMPPARVAVKTGED
ncbi:hypothetical protein NOJ28_10490 [Neorhizobium galegae]|uniref:hypothetical protein n=1 Tax=Neorhizobium galegae TaxID=399 RepID=UPI000ABA069F|nr:hypothetical protein [Neorhizobium galegae]MCQ1765961.1 hypothetical protein [Neorhizobium galegae]MCQ1844875.1 hypothetical protein [Neorhizobium galegae]